MPTVQRQPHLTPEQIESLGQELDEIRTQVIADLGTADASYIRRSVRLQARLELCGRALFFLGFLPPAWVAGVACLTIARLLNTNEIGHNVLHGQYDWMRDPSLDSQTYEWSELPTSKDWRHSHNFMHHTYTNILGRDRDIGFGIIRMSKDQKWHPYYLGNPIYAGLLMLFIDWGFALHDLEVDRIIRGECKLSEKREVLGRMVRKISRHLLREYVLHPALTGPLFLSTLAGNACANLLHNLCNSSFIFCGHFPDGAVAFTEEETRNETQGHWYYRQLVGSANFSAGKFVQHISGHLSHQIEHHLFPDLPACRYPQIATQVRAVCERYGIPYNTDPLHRQLGSTWHKLVKLALPPAKRTSC